MTRKITQNSRNGNFITKKERKEKTEICKSLQVRILPEDLKHI